MTTETNTTAVKTETQSFKIFKTLVAKRRRGATVQNLADATGLKIAYMGSYIHELRRVQGATVVFNKDSKRYFLKNIAAVRQAFAAAK